MDGDGVEIEGEMGERVKKEEETSSVRKTCQRAPQSARRENQH